LGRKEKDKQMKKDGGLEEGRYARATMDCAFKAVMQNAEVRLALISDFLGRDDIVSTEPYLSAVPSIRRSGRTQKYRDGSQRKLGSS
jgi:hypothetical protein